MNEVYSKIEDCAKLAVILKEKLGNKISFDGSIYQEVISGKYISLYRLNKEKYNLNKTSIPFSFKFCEGEFLRISVSDNIDKSNTLSEKLVALSDFYLVLNDLYGLPTVFFTRKNDLENMFSLHYSFTNTKECIESFKNGTFIIDAEIEDLIIFNKEHDKLSEIRSKNIGLPVELLKYLDNDIDNYFIHKEGRIEDNLNQKQLIKIK